LDWLERFPNAYCTIIVETASRFARDLMVQEVGFAKLQALGKFRSGRLVGELSVLIKRRHSEVVYRGIWRWSAKGGVTPQQDDFSRA
jgi:hypothetical protein